MNVLQKGLIRVLLFAGLFAIILVNIYANQLVSLHFSGRIEVKRRPFDSYVHFALLSSDKKIIPFDTCTLCSGVLTVGEKREVRLTVFLSFACEQWKKRDVNNTLQLLAYYSERMNINTVLFSDNCTFLESIFPNTTVFDIPEVNKFGIPVLRPMFEMVRSHFDSELIMFMNSDILPSYETMKAPLDYYACHPESRVSLFQLYNVDCVFLDDIRFLSHSGAIGDSSSQLGSCDIRKPRITRSLLFRRLVSPFPP